MEIVIDPADCPKPPNGSVVTIGVYDGVHLGHRALISRVRKMASELGAATVVVTFDRHPATVVRPESAPLLLTDLEQRLELLASTGVDTTLVLRFDKERASEPAEEFVEEILVGALRARAVAVGHDFHFGQGRKGNVALLHEMGAKLGFDVLGMNLVPDPDHGQAVSSTRVRGLLLEGDVAGAAALLGRHHEVRGVVQHGDARGRDLGFPTANVAVAENICLPADGVYAGWFERTDGSAHPAAISLGRRPTFYGEHGLRLLEAYLLGFDASLYDERAKVRFVSRVRGQERFDSVEALVEQMHLDVEAVRQALAC